MKFGIYYAYWEKEWKGDFIPYVKRVKDLGFDILEVACGDFHHVDRDYFPELRKVAEENGVILTGGYGPRPEHNLANPDPAAIKEALAFYKDVFEKMELAGIDRIGGALYSYWPVDFAAGFDKAADLDRSITNMKTLADLAADYGITLCMESLNRFEGYLINTAKEDLAYVEAVDKANVVCMLDSFHMNIEEDDFSEAIRTCGKKLGHFHVGEANRKPPYAGGRMPWRQIFDALAEIGYDGYVVMEPFVMTGGKVGQDISVWREIFEDTSDAALDQAAKESVAFLKSL